MIAKIGNAAARSRPGSGCVLLRLPSLRFRLLRVIDRLFADEEFVGMIGYGGPHEIHPDGQRRAGAGFVFT